MSGVPRLTRILIMSNLVVILYYFFFRALGSAQQSDWSGGSGYLGPGLEWSNLFFESSSVDWYRFPDSLFLEVELVSTFLFQSIANAQNPVGFTISDIDGDQLDDFVIGQSYLDAISWFSRDPENPLQWVQHTVTDSYSCPRELLAFDIDNDMDTDIVSGGEFNENFCWWENSDGAGEFWLQHQITDSSQVIHGLSNGDFNNDGFIDILGICSTADGAFWLENPGGQPIVWDRHSIGSLLYNPNASSAIDIDYDGDIDFACVESPTAGFYWYENTDGLGGGFLCTSY